MGLSWAILVHPPAPSAISQLKKRPFSCTVRRRHFVVITTWAGFASSSWKSGQTKPSRHFRSRPWSGTSSAPGAMAQVFERAEPSLGWCRTWTMSCSRTMTSTLQPTSETRVTRALSRPKQRNWGKLAMEGVMKGQRVERQHGPGASAQRGR